MAVVMIRTKIERHAQPRLDRSEGTDEADVSDRPSDDGAMRLVDEVKLHHDFTQRVHRPVQGPEVQHLCLPAIAGLARFDPCSPACAPHEEVQECVQTDQKVHVDCA